MKKIKDMSNKANDFVEQHRILTTISTFILFHVLLYMIFSSIVSSTVTEYYNKEQANQNNDVYISLINDNASRLEDNLEKIEMIYEDDMTNREDKIKLIEARVGLIHTFVEGIDNYGHLEVNENFTAEMSEYNNLHLKEIRTYEEIAKKYLEQLKLSPESESSDFHSQNQIELLKIIAERRRAEVEKIQYKYF